MFEFLKRKTYINVIYDIKICINAYNFILRYDEDIYKVNKRFESHQSSKAHENMKEKEFFLQRRKKRFDGNLNTQKRVQIHYISSYKN